MFDNGNPALLVPVVKGDPIRIDLAKIFAAEARIREVEIVNIHKAPELLSVFNRAYLGLNDLLRSLELHLHAAKAKAAQRRSIVLLDEVPKILKAKGLATARSPGGCEDQRQAILDGDAEYIADQDRVAQIQAMVQLLRGKQEGFEWAFTAVKRIVERTSDAGQVGTQRTSAGGEQGFGLQPVPGGRIHPGFGGAGGVG